MNFRSIAIGSLVLALTNGCARDETPDDTTTTTAADDDDALDDGDAVPDAGPVEQFECSPDQLDDCPPDTKCTAIVADDGTSYSYECVTDTADLEPNDTCTPAPGTGVDYCPPGYACIPDTNLTPTEGHCLELCAGDDTCPDGLCTAMPASPIPVCAQTCQPLLATCPATYACRLLEDRAFGCVIPLPDDIGVQGSQCDGIHQLGCANGFVCMPSFQVPDCLDADFCCTAVCPVDGMSDCPMPSTCTALTLENDVLFENVGVCAI